MWALLKDILVVYLQPFSREGERYLKSRGLAASLVTMKMLRKIMLLGLGFLVLSLFFALSLFTALMIGVEQVTEFGTFFWEGPLVLSLILALCSGVLMVALFSERQWLKILDFDQRVDEVRLRSSVAHANGKGKC